MARIPLVDPDDPGTDPAVAARLLDLRQQFGGDNNYFLAMANSGPALEGMLSLSKAAYFGPHLDPAMTELAYLGASLTNGCHY